MPLTRSQSLSPHSFRADIDYGRIGEREATRVDRLKTTCPSGFSKRCKGPSMNDKSTEV